VLEVVRRPRAEQRRNRWTAVALWAIAALLAVVAWKIM